PHPPNHESPDFLTSHGGLARIDGARCAVCHARETCEACHVNGTQLEPIQALPSDPRVLSQASRITPRWPMPADHDDPEWLRHHGPLAGRADSRCANCHAQSSCTDCHGPSTIPQVEIARLPISTGARAGLTPVRAKAGSFHPAGFRLGHGPQAVSGTTNCSSCHREKEFCGGCHEGTTSSGFHPSGYLNRHAADAYARDTDCAGCHSNEVSCRSCHENVGLAGFNSKSASYHDAQPFWLLAHGQAARAGLETCASCHQQTDCLQCHSARSGWRINPHGDAFDAERLSDRGQLMCSRCHFSDPVPGAGRERVAPE
ncbi:MAG: cytochrome c3 family protein, partial [Candidatus Eisenbacteria bacterium]|nr:cytochrome c3 family protein [Candidatus Eisenbacteria bacterium]